MKHIYATMERSVSFPALLFFSNNLHEFSVFFYFLHFCTKFCSKGMESGNMMSAQKVWRVEM